MYGCILLMLKLKGVNKWLTFKQRSYYLSLSIFYIARYPHSTLQWDFEVRSSLWFWIDNRVNVSTIFCRIMIWCNSGSHHLVHNCLAGIPPVYETVVSAKSGFRYGQPDSKTSHLYVYVYHDHYSWMQTFEIYLLQIVEEIICRDAKSRILH